MLTGVGGWPGAVLLSRSLRTRLLAMLLFHVPLAIGLVIGIFRSVQRRHLALSVLSLFTAAYLLIHAPEGDLGGRNSVPIIPVLIAITGYVVFGEQLQGRQLTLHATRSGFRGDSSALHSSVREVDSVDFKRGNRLTLNSDARDVGGA